VLGICDSAARRDMVQKTVTLAEVGGGEYRTIDLGVHDIPPPTPADLSSDRASRLRRSVWLAT